MKTLKFALIAAIVACTMVSLASADGFKSRPKFRKVALLSLDKAMENPGLVAAIYAQVDREDILNSASHVYTAEVTYQGSVYRITGSLDKWIRFFRMQGVGPATTKLKGLKTD